MPHFRSVLLLTAFLTMISALACSTQAPQPPAAPPDTRKADEAAIRAASADWSKAAQAKDLEKAVSTYAEDAVYFADKGAMVKGRNSIRLAWKTFLDVPGAGLTFAPTFVEVARSGDLAYEYGTYDFITEEKKGKPKDEKGKYVVIWRKQPDGKWKAIVDINNTGE